MERLSCLAHDNDLGNVVFSDILWTDIEGEPFDIHAQSQKRIASVVARAVGVIYDSFQKYTKFNKKKRNKTLLYSKTKSTNKTTNHIIPIIAVKNVLKIMTFCSIINDDIKVMLNQSHGIDSSQRTIITTIIAIINKISVLIQTIIEILVQH